MIPRSCSFWAVPCLQSTETQTGIICRLIFSGTFTNSPSTTRVYRIEVVDCFLTDGTPTRDQNRRPRQGAVCTCIAVDVDQMQFVYKAALTLYRRSLWAGI